MLNRVACILIALLPLASLDAVSGNIVKWTDENGKVHFGDEVPEKYKQKSSQIEINNDNIIKNDNALKNDRFIKRRNARERRERVRMDTQSDKALIARQEQERKCQKEYGVPCERLINWKRYAREECLNARRGRKCKDPEILKEYRVLSLAEKEVIANKRRSLIEAERAKRARGFGSSY